MDKIATERAAMLKTEVDPSSWTETEILCYHLLHVQ